MIALDHEGNKLIIRERIGGNWCMYLFAIVCVGAIADELAKRTFGNLTIPIGAIASLFCGVFVFYRLQRRSVIIDQDDRTIVFEQGNILTSKSRLYFFDDLISPFKVISAPRPLNRGGNYLQAKLSDGTVISFKDHRISELNEIAESINHVIGRKSLPK